MSPVFWGHETRVCQMPAGHNGPHIQFYEGEWHPAAVWGWSL